MEKYIVFCFMFLVAVFFVKKRYWNGSKHENKSYHHRHRSIHKHGEGFSIDLYAYNSKIRHWNPSFKVSLSVITLIFCIVLDNPYVSIVVIIAMAYLIIVKGGLSIHEYIPIFIVQIGFILLGTFTIAIDFSKQSMGQYNLYLGFFYVFTSQEKLKEVILLILKIFAAISALQMMILSTPSSEIIHVLRKARVPKLIIELMNIIYRYIFILIDVYIKMKNSAESRQGYYDFKTSCYTFGSIASNMLLVSFKKASSHYDAMEARCYDGDIMFLEEDKKLETIQIVKAAAFIIFLIVIWGITR